MIKIIIFFIILNSIQLAVAQQSASTSLTPNELSSLNNAVLEADVKAQELKQKESSQAQAVAAQAPAIAPVDNDSADPILNGRKKSPFMIPNELYKRIKKNQAVKVVTSDGSVDDSVEVRRRWPLNVYRLVGVLWNVKKPKALIRDKDGTVNVYKVRDYIANAEGYVAEINNGEVIVVERGAEIKLKLLTK